MMLDQLQSTSTRSTLSERIIVTLVEKLTKEYDLNIVHSQDGQEYITLKYLYKQILDTVKNKRKVGLVDLPAILNVNLEKIQAVIDQFYKYEFIRMEQ